MLANIPPVSSYWREIPRPLPPCRFALRRTAPTGPRILVLATDTQVISRADHGTERASRFVHGEAHAAGDIAALIADACAHWDRILADAPPSARPRSRFSYRTRQGAFSAPASIDELFDLLASGELAWSAQVWDPTLSSGGGAWIAIAEALGFPRHDDIVQDAKS